MNSEGIHHITAIAGNPQTNLDFYAGVLELKFIKKTINYDDPGTYHFYFGDQTGNPGTILTFFPWGKNANKGKAGRGQVTAISFSVPSGTLYYWQERLTRYKVIFNGPYERLGERLISFEDPDGIEIELIETDNTLYNGTAINGFHSATLSVESLAMSESILTGIFGFSLTGNEENRYRFTAGSNYGRHIDLLIVPDLFSGNMGVGAVHHIAFRALTETSQLEMREVVEKINIMATPVIDRKYFKSVYFREPNGILFEIATDKPGFLVDEEENELGKKLQLPEWLETKRDVIEKSLQSLTEPSPERVYLR